MAKIQKKEKPIKVKAKILKNPPKLDKIISLDIEDEQKKQAEALHELFFPYVEEKRSRRVNFYNDSKNVFNKNAFNDNSLGFVMTKAMIENYGLDNIENIIDMYESGYITFDGTREEFYDEVNHVKDRFKKLESDSMDIVFVETLKQTTLPYLKNYLKTIEETRSENLKTGYFDSNGLDYIHEVIQDSVNKITSYVDYVNENQDKNENDPVRLRLMKEARDSIKISNERIKILEFEIEKNKSVIHEIKDEKEIIRGLSGCKFIKPDKIPRSNFMFARQIEKMQKNIPEKPAYPIYNCAQCKESDYTDYLDLMDKIEVKEDSKETYESEEFSKNWILEDVSENLINNPVFLKVINGGNFENVDEVLDVAKCVFDGVNKAVINSPLKNAINLRYNVSDGNFKLVGATGYARTRINENIQEITVIKTPFKELLEKQDDLSTLIFTIVTILHESFHAFDCSLRGEKHFENPESVNTNVKELQNRGLINGNKITKEDLYFLSALSPNLAEKLKGYMDENNLPPSIVVPYIANIATAAIDRAQDVEVNAHKFSFYATHAVFDTIEGKMRERGATILADKVSHNDKIIEEQAFQTNKESLDTKKIVYEMLEDVVKDSSEVYSVDAIEHLLINHYIHAGSASEAEAFTGASKRIFKNYYLNLSEENQEKLKQESLASAKLLILDEIRHVVNLEIKKSERNVVDDSEKTQPVKPLRFTKDDIIKLCEVTKKAGIVNSTFIYHHFEGNEESFMQAYNYYIEKGDLKVVSALMPSAYGNGLDNKKFETYIKTTIETIFSIPEDKRDNDSVYLLLYQLKGYISEYNSKNKNNPEAYDYSDVLEMIEKEDERINESEKQKEEELLRGKGKSNKTTALPDSKLMLPEDSSASEMGG